eukprot:gnl/Hemi2/19494_TR6480_c0_g2_i1.p1 gnl/Hemi2/19494_TR6480_c0_g2~~gnl/Hemi2/19494_TR6480_c0_g2_i1.p1  ORF type:complete len:142 (-),score=26.55 gnl/Hemi2/19494_TR6480_c0_g2_i1:24-449(-)
MARRLYRQFLRLIPAYVDSPGVKEFMQRNVSANMRRQGMKTEDLLEAMQMLQDTATLRELCREQLRSEFTAVTNTNPKLTAQLVREGRDELLKIQKMIIQGGMKIPESNPISPHSPSSPPPLFDKPPVASNRSSSARSVDT